MSNRPYTYIPQGAAPRTRRRFRIRINFRIIFYITLIVSAGYLFGGFGAMPAMIWCLWHANRVARRRRCTRRVANPNHPYGG